MGSKDFFGVNRRLIRAFGRSESMSIWTRSRRNAGLILAVVLLLTSVPTSCGITGASVSATPGIVVEGPVEIWASMELLAGVLSQTSWIERRGPSGCGNEYFRTLKDFMEPYKDHEAVKIAEELTARGFTYDAPISFICHCGPLPDLELVYEYSKYVVGRAGGHEILESFRKALKDLAAESNFMRFFRDWAPRMREYIEATIEDFRYEEVTDWLNRFFGWETLEFHIILAPAMFPGGGYGATITDQGGNLIAFQVVREMGRSESVPQFQSGRSLERLTLHELGHSFVNPSLEKHSSRVARLQPLFQPVAARMTQMAYPDVRTFMNEQILRAVTSVAAKELEGEAAFEAALEYEENQGFYLTRFITEKILVYTQNRAKYPKFTDFVPYLLDQLEAYQAQKTAQETRPIGTESFIDFLRNSGVIGLGIILVMIGVLLLRVRHRGGQE